MSTLTGNKIKDTYDGLLKTTDSTQGLPATGRTTIEDGLGNDSAIALGRSTQGITVSGNIDVTGDNNAVKFDSGTKYIGDHSVDGFQIRTENTDDILFKTNGNNTRMRVDGAGDVSVANNLTVNGEFTVDSTAQFEDVVTMVDKLNVQGIADLAQLKLNSNNPVVNKIVTALQGIANNDNDTSFPTCAAVKDLVDGVTVDFDWLSTTETNGNTDTLAITLRNGSGTTIEQFFFNSQGLQLSRLASTENVIVGKVMRIDNTDSNSRALHVKGNASIQSGGNLNLSSGAQSYPTGSMRIISAGDGHNYLGVVKNFLNVGNNNDIDDTINGAAIGQANTMNEADASIALGAGNNLNGTQLTSDTMRSLALGFNNDVRGFSSVAMGGNNDVFTGQNGFALGFDNNLTSGGDNNFAIGESNTQSGTNANGVFMIGVSLHGEDGEFTMGYRNDRTSYPSTDYANGLGEVKVVIGTGTVNDSNGMIMTEGGVTRGGGTQQKTRVIFPSVTDFNFSSDANAAAGGIPVGGMYHNNGDLKIRLT
jgi:hypothetical protein